VLKRVDSFLAWLSWVAAALLVVMLIIGPKVIAEDKAKPTGKTAGSAPSASDSRGGARAEGKSVFTDNCGSCHALQAAGTSGQGGPNLDNVSLSAADVEGIVRGGRGIMPAFGGRLSDAEISAVATFVAGQR
jgi:mono/diheme cytochrome c family protein